MFRFLSPFAVVVDIIAQAGNGRCAERIGKKYVSKTPSPAGPISAKTSALWN